MDREHYIFLSEIVDDNLILWSVNIHEGFKKRAGQPY